MDNTPGRGPTRKSKTNQRMAQERASPGATSAGGHSADAGVDDPPAGTGRSAEVHRADASTHTAARRGDDADPSTDAVPPLPPAV